MELPCARACDGALATWVLTHSSLQQSAAVHLNQHFWDVALPAFYVIGVFFKLFQPGISGALVKGRKAGDRKFKQRNKRTMGRHKVWAICTHRLCGARCASWEPWKKVRYEEGDNMAGHRGGARPVHGLALPRLPSSAMGGGTKTSPQLHCVLKVKFQSHGSQMSSEFYF